MKNYLNFTLIAVLFVGICFTSCKDDTSEGAPEVNAAQTLMDHLISIDMDINHVLKNTDGQKFVMPAPADGNVSSKYVIDIRSEEAFNSGHIAGAHNVELKNILNEAQVADKPILVVCYTGQTACYATSLLRLYGYHDAQALKWGMSGWNSTTDSWSPQIDDIADGHENWSYGAEPTKGVYEIPEFSSVYTEGADILKERVETVLAAGFKTAKASDVLNTPTQYYINNYFNTTDYGAFGHIDGAYRLHELFINPSSSEVSSVKNLNPDKSIVTYCYTGQTSAVITAYLRVLGYDAHSLTFGMNKLYNSNSNWSSNQWGGDSNSKDLPLSVN